eukprot:3349051-Ditylum_brightwellii.AAC.1
MTCPTITTILTQYHVSCGLTVFGQPGIEAVLTELKQLHNWIVLKLRSPEEMTKQEKSAALQYLMFLKKKRCGKSRAKAVQMAGSSTSTRQRRRLAPLRWLWNP